MVAALTAERTAVIDATYIITSLAYAVTGFVGGYVVGVAAREIHEVKEAVVETPKDEPELEERRSGTDRRSIPTSTFNKRMGLALLVLSLLTVTAVAISNIQFRNQASCQFDYNKAAAAALQERTEAANLDRTAFNKSTEAINDVFSIVVRLSTSNEPSTKQDQAEFIQALIDYRVLWNDYQRQLKESDQTRAENPLPPFPEDDCG